MALKTNGFGGSGTGGFFKAKDHLNVLAVLIEPLRSSTSPNKFGGTNVNTVCDITLFPTEGHLTGKEDPIVLTDVTIGGGVLGKDMEAEIGNQCFGRLAQKENKKGSAPLVVLDPIGDPAAIEAVEKYLEKRAAEQADAVPDFLKG